MASRIAGTSGRRCGTRKLTEELVESFSALEVVEERLYGHPGADEDRRAAEDLGVAVYDLAQLGHADRSVEPSTVYTARF